MIHYILLADGPPDGTSGWFTIVGPLGGAAITAVGALLIWWLNRKRGQYVTVLEEGRVSLLRIAEDVRQRIITTLDGKVVADLSQIAVRITNSGTEILRNLELQFDFGPETTVLQIEVTPPSHAIVSEAGPHVIKLAIPYLNSSRFHADTIHVTVVCDGTVELLAVHGRGEGWSVRWRKGVALLRLATIKYFITMLALVLTSTLYVFIATFAWGISPNEWSWRAAGVSLPPFFIFVGVFFVLQVWFVRKVRKYQGG
jgi:hypothetical protein